MGSGDSPSSKTEWRTRFRAYRRGLSRASQRARSALIDHRALGHSAVVSADVVHAYWPQVEAGEIDTRPLIAALHAQDVTVALPVVASYEPGDPRMEHRAYVGRQGLKTNRWGIPEPVDSPPVAPDDLDAVLVPTLGADRTGARLGRGAGYYDAFLSGVTAPCLGLVYDACVVPSLPTDSHDVPLTALITERRTEENTPSSSR